MTERKKRELDMPLRGKLPSGEGSEKIAANERLFRLGQLEGELAEAELDFVVAEF